MIKCVVFGVMFPGRIMARTNTRRDKIVWCQTVGIILLLIVLVWRECLCAAVQLGYSC